MRLPVDLIARAEQEGPKPDSIKAIRTRIADESPITLDGPERVERRKRMIAAAAVENVADAFERYIGDNDLLPVNYLSLGYLQSRSVGRIQYFDKREGKGAVATGFMVPETLLLTGEVE